jgi:hypothetical protein
VVRFITAPAERPGLSTATIRLLEDMPNLAVRVGLTPAPSAATARAGSRGVIRLAEVRVLVAGQRAEAVAARRTEAVVGLGAAVAVIDNQRIGVLLVVDREI